MRKLPVSLYTPGSFSTALFMAVRDPCLDDCALALLSPNLIGFYTGRARGSGLPTCFPVGGGKSSASLTVPQVQVKGRNSLPPDYQERKCLAGRYSG